MLQLKFINQPEPSSSVRNINGPLDGPPEIVITPQEPPKDASTSKSSSHMTASTILPPSSLEIMIMKSLGLADLDRVREKLKVCQGDPNRVINDLYEEMEKDWEEGEAEAEEGNSATKVEEPQSISLSTDRAPMMSDEGTEDVHASVTDDAAPWDAKEASNRKSWRETRAESADTPTATGSKQPKEKKLSNRERKEAAKKARKEKAVTKKRSNTSSSSSNVAAPKAPLGALVEGMHLISI